MSEPGDRYCRACGSALNALSNCPHGCHLPAPKEPRKLFLVDDEDEDIPEWEPDEDSDEWRP